jgi:hypothetical protein
MSFYFKSKGENMKEQLKQLEALGIQPVSKEDQLQTYYRGNMGLTLQIGPWLDALAFSIRDHAFEVTDTHIKVFVDLLEPLMNLEKTFTHVLVRVHPHIITLPVEEVVEVWNAGWPRAGILIERFISYPWRFLKPLYDVLNHSIDLIHLKMLFHPPVTYALDQKINETYRIFREELATIHNFNEAIERIQTTYDTILSLEKTRLDDALKRASIRPELFGIIVHDESILNNSHNPLSVYAMNYYDKFRFQT